MITLESNQRSDQQKERTRWKSGDGESFSSGAQARHWHSGKGQTGGLKQRQQVDSCWPGRSSITAVPPFHRLPSWPFKMVCALISAGKWMRLKCRFYVLWSKKVLSGISDKWDQGSIHSALLRLCWGTCQTANRKCARSDKGKKILIWWRWIIWNINLCSLHLVMSRIITPTNEYIGKVGCFGIMSLEIGPLEVPICVLAGAGVPCSSWAQVLHTSPLLSWGLLQTSEPEDYPKQCAGPRVPSSKQTSK